LTQLGVIGHQCLTIVSIQAVPVQLTHTIDMISTYDWHYLVSIAENRLTCILAESPHHVSRHTSAIDFGLDLHSFASRSSIRLTCTTLLVIARLAALTFAVRAFAL
jgi:hypothetical protein